MDAATDIAIPPDSITPAKSVWHIWLPRVAILIAIAFVVFLAGNIGVRWRHWVWDTTVPLRFTGDIDRGFAWGRLAATEGFLNQYEKMQPQRPSDSNWLDYGPLRLGVMTLWAQWSFKHFPQIKSWHDDHSYALTAPVLRFNLFMEAVGLISAFFLARLWAIRSCDAIAPSTALRWFFRGCIPGLLAAGLLWFNPAIVIDAYGWPSWDLWIVPFFLLAALMASLDWWFTAGIILGIGAMFKGQQLVALPVFAIWSLVLGRPLRTFQLFAGATFAIAMVTFPWLITYIPADKLAAARSIQSMHGQAAQAPVNTFKLVRSIDVPALIWVFGIVVASSAGPWVSWLQLAAPAEGVPTPQWRNAPSSRWAWPAIAAFTTVVLVMWPWFIKRNHPTWMTGFVAAIALAAAVLFVRPRGIAYLCTSATGITLLLCMSVFHGSSAWYDCGIHFGTVHWPQMAVGMADNLPAILASDFDWPMSRIDVTAVTIPAHFLLLLPAQSIGVSMKELLLTIFWIALVLCGLGMGMQARRKDSRILIALTATWLVFYCFPPQIHERYLLFAAGVSCICTGVSTGMTLLGVFLSLVSALMTLHTMLVAAGWDNLRRFSKPLSEQYPRLFSINTGSKMLELANGTHPGLGYAVVLCTLIFLYYSLAPRRTKGGKPIAAIPPPIQ